jgi:AcrR family transcriptional regulator
MQQTQDTDERILTAFLRLAAEQGLDGVTTRELAAEAGVNPVTLFRRFGDKTTLAVAAIRRYSPAPKLQGLDPGIDPAHAAEGLVEALLLLVDLTAQPRRTPWLRLAVRRMSQVPSVHAEIEAVIQSVYGFVRRALDQAGPALRPEVDHHVTALQLIGLIRVAERVTSEDSEPSSDQWRALFQAAIRPLLREV